MSERVLPVIVSVVVIIGIAFINQYSKSFAAIFTTLPVKITLAVWIVYSAEQGNAKELSEFSTGLLAGIIPNVMYIIGIWMAARADYGLVQMLLSGAVLWAITLMVTLGIRQLV